MPKLTLCYFNGRGKAEPTRYMLKMAGVDFEDKRIGGDDWKNTWKPKMPFGSMPVLIVDDVMIPQSSAIERYVARTCGFLPEGDLNQARADAIMAYLDDIFQASRKATSSSEDPAAKKAACLKFAKDDLPDMLKKLENMVQGKYFFKGDKLTWPDIATAHTLSFFPIMEMPVDLNEWPKLKVIKEKVEGHPAVAKWIKERPQTQF